MFHHIPHQILRRMQYLEELDAQERQAGVPRTKRLRQVPPDTGRFIALLAAAAPEGHYIEIGTSAGYSTLWLALACRSLNKTVTTFEVLDSKAKLARETFRLAEVEDVVDFVHGDAIQFLPDCKNIAFCFLDAEKEMYQACFDIVIPNLVPGGLLVADNTISHEEVLRPMIDKALTDQRVDALIVPIGKGELVCRKV